ncbi:hypothetical protein AC578_7678 [Pseudocercospora eumusae]|uniref:CorA-like transporter domain-containing protein n=1 Tax=Pseudocercospora eumusae TaxID=321146 RepID=A0A139GUX2_9PEZI|nr:hypothetical protein AC578_7678 [Pseudocercospora eumusae]KXS93980.1 hypothetical protein AC578_7678 [Pseudocercospora eumusae]KXS93982.1 hypothetical protein AC578_7678 [Pseudocercospora eumusae]
MAARSTNFQKLLTALSNATSYPQNGSGIEVHDYTATVLKDQLNSRAQKLFCKDNQKADLRLYELHRTSEGLKYELCTINTATGLRKHLNVSVSQHRDPRQRFIFIGAKDSRSVLRITEEMMLQLLTYHQIAHGFLTFIFPFGKQQHARDLHLSGFRSDTCSASARASLKLSELGRSGRHVELCYNLRSVENKTKIAPGIGNLGATAIVERLQQWSIRPCSVHHKLDLETQQMTWVIIKANDVLQKAIQDRLGDSPREESELHEAFNTTLIVHSIITRWAGENWHWYINELEGILQDKTRRAISIPLHAASLGLPDLYDPAHLLPRAKTKRTWSLPVERSPTIESLQKVFSWPSLNEDTAIPMTEEPQSLTRPSTFADDSTLVVEDNISPPTNESDRVSFSDLQTIQYLEDEANKTLLTLKSNATVIKDLDQEYRCILNTLSQERDFQLCKESFDRFSHHLRSVENGLNLQQARLETLLRIFADRKAMLQNILQWRNMKTMEEMTRQMHDLARRTQHETVYMRTITLVTLFCLPGTFISTLMSTPIVDFSNKNTNPKDFSWRDNIGVGALKLYLIFSLPMILITFVAWGVVHKLVRRRERQSARARTDFAGDKAC